MSHKRELPPISPAVAEMLDRDGVLDEILSGRGLRFDNPPPPLPEPQPFHIPPPDWHEEERERLARERQLKEQERAGILEEELAKLTDDQADPEPIPKRRGWKIREAQR